MLQFNDLSYYAIPSLPKDYQVPAWLPIEVGFFAGRIYFEWHEYEGILNFLGLKPTATMDSSQSDSRSFHTFTPKPLAFLQDWISARRKMQDWSSSPMGFIVAGKKLYAHHPFFSIAGGVSAKNKKIVLVGKSRRRAAGGRL
jgi:hypothetical protein